MKYEALKPKVVVFDRWWPWRVGSVVKRSKSSAHIEWSDGEVWRYDVPHMKFLELL